MFNNQGNSKPEASHSENDSENGDMASEWEELVELDDVQLATIVGGWGLPPINPYLLLNGQGKGYVYVSGTPPSVWFSSRLFQPHQLNGGKLIGQFF